MYRILESEGEARERRDQLMHPTYTKPELLDPYRSRTGHLVCDTFCKVFSFSAAVF
jgi:hypothetical protein